MTREDEFYPQAVRRIYRFLAGVTGAAVLIALLWQGPGRAAGFALGAAAAILNLRWTHQLVEALGPGGRRPSRWLLVWLGLRYLLFGLGGYVIVKIFGVNVVAVLCGLFVPVAAAILEVFYELIYART